jgi:hypothetical protein
VAQRHAASLDAVQAIFQALKQNRARMARFTHPDFGGKSLWTPDRTEISNMSDIRLRSKLSSIAAELTAYLHRSPDALS